MPKIFTSDEDKGMRAIFRGFNEMAEIVLDVGFFPDSGKHSIHTDDEDKPIPYADLARWNEEGQPEKNVPARPFMRSVLDSNSAKYWEELATKSLDDLEEGINVTRSHQALKRVGRVIAGDIQKSIKMWDDPKNSDWTIKKKGFNNPLVDYGELADAVQYKIRRTQDPNDIGGEKEIFRGGVK